jgi:hypothetical protein
MPEKTDQELAVTTELLTRKLELITTGRPWRLWLALKNLNLGFLKKSVARREFEKSLAKIEVKATRGAHLPRLTNGAEKTHAVLDGLSSKHPLHRQILELNREMPVKALKKEGDWVVASLDLALRGECYGVALGLTNYFLAIFRTLEPALQGRGLTLALETLVAIGETDRAIELLVRYSEQAQPSDRMASIRSVLMRGRPRSEKDFLLPSGKLNAFVINRWISSGELNSGELISLCMQHRAQFRSNPQLFFLVHNAARFEQPGVALYALNEFHAHYRLPEVKPFAYVAPNFLSRVEFRETAGHDSGPLVSIIMSAYNAEKTIDFALSSLLAQTYRNIEVLVCNDADRGEYWNEVKDRFRSDPRIRFFRSKENQGTYNIRNALIREARGELVTFHDSDDLALPTRIESQVAVFRDGKSVACIARWLRITPEGEVLFFRDQAALRMCVVSLMAPKALFLKQGGYRAVRFGADTEFYEKLRSHFGDDLIAKVKVPLVWGLAQDGSLTRSAGAEALETGFRGLARRTFAETAFARNFLGKDIASEEWVQERLTGTNNLCAPRGVESEP